MRIDMRSGQNPEGILQVSGRLIDAWVADFEATCLQRLRTGMSLTVDLGELIFVDAAGIKAVRRLVRQGVEFTGGTAFIRQRLKLPQE